MILKETILSIIGKVGWKVIGERFMTRLVIYGLNKLESYSTNTVVKQTVADIVNQLKGKKLKVVDDER
jgi:hypothetical protein